MNHIGLLPKFFTTIFKETNSNNEFAMEQTSETLSKLKFIGKIKEGEKINVKYMYVQPCGLLTRISRTLLYQDNRTNTFNFIEATIQRSLDIVTLSKFSSKSADKSTIHNIIKDLQEALKGIENLKKTYIDDVMFCCKIDTLIQKTDASITTLKETFESTSEEDEED